MSISFRDERARKSTPDLPRIQPSNRNHSFQTPNVTSLPNSSKSPKWPQDMKYQLHELECDMKIGDRQRGAPVELAMSLVYGSAFETLTKRGLGGSHSQTAPSHRLKYPNGACPSKMKHELEAMVSCI